MPRVAIHLQRETVRRHDLESLPVQVRDVFRFEPEGDEYEYVIVVDPMRHPDLLTALPGVLSYAIRYARNPRGQYRYHHATREVIHAP